MTPGVNFTDILRAAFAPIFFCKKITHPNCNSKCYSEKLCKTFLFEKAACKMLAGEIDTSMANRGRDVFLEVGESNYHMIFIAYYILSFLKVSSKGYFTALQLNFQ